MINFAERRVIEMRVPKIFTAIAAAILLTSANVPAEAIDMTDGVDWQKRVITVTGEGRRPRLTLTSNSVR